MRTKRRALRRQWVTLGAASLGALALPCRTARADSLAVGAGFFLSYSAGPRSGLEWGFEAFATHRFKGGGSCSSEPRTGVGSLMQFGLAHGDQPRVTVAALGGGELERSLLAVSGELGVTYRFGSAEGLDLHAGFVPELTFFNLALRYQALLQDVSFGGGMRVMPTFGMPGSCSEEVPPAVGRPLRTETGVAQPTAALREGELHDAGAERIEEVGLAWERDAQLECASIPAFLQLACELAWHGAPWVLVQRALDAVRDEAFHADACAKIASMHLVERLTPVLPDVTPRAPGGLIRLAVESWLDGCLGEGRAARAAARASTGAASERLAALQRRIARDEERHAELAWDVLGWALVRGGDDVREALRAVRNVHAEPALATEPSGFERFGRLGTAEVDRVSEEHAARARARLDRLLG